MSNVQNDNSLIFSVDFINCTIIADSQSPEIRMHQFFPTFWSIAQNAKFFSDPIPQIRICTFKEIICFWMKQYFVAHPIYSNGTKLSGCSFDSLLLSVSILKNSRVLSRSSYWLRTILIASLRLLNLPSSIHSSMVSSKFFGTLTCTCIILPCKHMCLQHIYSFRSRLPENQISILSCKKSTNELRITQV